MILAELACDLLRPVITRLPRGKTTALSLLGGWKRGHRHWIAASQPCRVFYDRSLRAWLLADLRDLGQRMHYYHGSHPDPWNRWLIEHLLRPGDAYVDIGANVGVHSLRAAAKVGPSGAVFSVEPNPRTAQLLRTNLLLNDATNVTVLEYALADTTRLAEMRGDQTDNVMFSLRPGKQGPATLRVPLRRGDEVLPDLDAGRRALVKIDVEGFEVKVVRGLTGWIERNRPFCVNVEVVPDWISDSQDSVPALFGIMHELGYVPHRPCSRRTLLGHFSFNLTPTLPPQTLDRICPDIAFLRSGEGQALLVA